MYRNCWGFRYGATLTISERKYRLEAASDALGTGFFGDRLAGTILYLPAAEVESLVEDAGCALVDLDAEGAA